MANLFWLSDEHWAVIEPFMPRDQPGPERKDDRQIISGILHVRKWTCFGLDTAGDFLRGHRPSHEASESGASGSGSGGVADPGGEAAEVDRRRRQQVRPG